eukprot:4960647-Pleurochrysis_carterae.AAC.7
MVMDGLCCGNARLLKLIVIVLLVASAYGTVHLRLVARQQGATRKTRTAPREAIMYAQRSVTVPVVTSHAGKAIFKCPESVPARAAIRFARSS